MIQKIVSDSFASLVAEIDDKKLIQAYVKKWKRIIEFVYRVRRVFKTIQKNINNMFWDNLPLVAFKIIKD